MGEHGNHFSRAHSDSSAGGLISGKGRRHGRFLGPDLYSEFVNHMRLRSMKPTALISVSNRLIDTLRRAFSKFYEDEEDPNQIWITFIHVPDVDKHVYHHAEGLAKKWNCPNPSRLRYEYIFEWEIPEKYLIHKVSVQTLIERGFGMEEYLLDDALPLTSILRKEVAKRLLQPSVGGYEIGLTLGLLARCFGARAPIRQIALQLLQDCSHVRFIDHDVQMVSASYWDREVMHLDFGHFRDIEDGIDTALYDWWLADPDFVYAYKEHCAWAIQIEEDLEREWDFWHEAKFDDDNIDVEKNERKKQQLQIKQYQADTRIEDAAIRLGL
ncbi:hypothetical protein SLS60_011739 [Paraconiothyrium brasiliense]|uniref:DUF7587 domain-containing protein n=1 Tax=Paraconiothyrium brasiliense TaxID=300254 RepID=A0ABR3QHV0_9PLEO